MWCVLECVSVRMLDVHVCECVRERMGVQRRDKDDDNYNYTRTHDALNLEEKKNKNHFSEMSRFYELKRCD